MHKNLNYITKESGWSARPLSYLKQSYLTTTFLAVLPVLTI